MGWSCTACTFRNLNEGSKSCITCGTKRSKEPTIDLTTTTAAVKEQADEKLPAENKSTFVKKRVASGSSSQRTLFGGVADESSKAKPTKKAKSDHPKQRPSTAAGAVAGSRQSTIAQNPAAAYRPITQDPYPVLQKRSKQILKDVFGINKLRNQQPKAVECALQNQSCIVVMATGGGKSLCYQLPALVKGGTTIVISPLIALMKDQVDALQNKGVAAACISSANGEKENVKIMERLLGRSMSTVAKKTQSQEPPVFQPLSLVYCTPELLQTTRFQNILQELYQKNQIALAAIDESHCMSSWGHDFRPAYRKLDFIRRAFPRLPCMALTATATPNVIQDLKQTLHLESSPCHVGSFDRSNIFYKVHYKDYLDHTVEGGSLGDMAKFICKQHKRAKTNQTSIAGIIYCHKREDTIYLAKEITKRTGIPAAGYHGGLKDTERTKVQTDWTNGNVSIVCATISFGMGIDLDCVRYVIHWSIPKTMSGFYQESGRAGRDGQSSISLVYYSKDDANKFAFLISKRGESSRKNGKGDGSSAQRDEQALQDVVNYCTQAQCRRQCVLRHFGEKETDPKTVCQQSCDFCCNPKRVETAIQSSVATRAISFQKKQAAKTKTAAKWDGQWDKPHGDNPSDEWGGGEEDWNVGGLGITSASNRDDGAGLSNKGGGGFRTAKSMVDWDQLEKQEAKEMGNQENNKSSGFMQFKTNGDTSTKTYKARDIYPEHLRQAINSRTETLTKTSKPKPKETTSTEHAEKAASLEAQLDAIKKQKEALLAKQRSSSALSAAAAPPPAPPAFTSSRKHSSSSSRRR